MTHPDTVREAGGRPVSTAAPEEGGPRFWLGLGLRLAGLLALSCTCSLGAFAIDFAVNGHQSPTVLTRQVGRGAMGVLGLLYVCWWARRAQVDWRQIWGSRPEVKVLAYSLCGGSLLYMCQETSVLAARGQLPLTLAAGGVPWAIVGADVLTGGLQATLCEEPLFRGLLPELFTQRGYGPKAVAALTACLFALFHVDLYLAPFRLTWIVVLGFVLIAIRRKTGSLLACLVLHLSHMATAFLLYWISGEAGR